MKLINCPTCQNQVSPAAAACPKCGHPIQPAGRENFAGKIILVVLLVIGAVWFLMATLNHLGSERQAAARISGSQ